MTNLITEARELCEKATPGPWEVKLHNEDYGQGYGETTFFVDMGGTLLKIGVADSAEKYAQYSAFSTFVARSRTLISELCDALEKAERESGCEWCADNYDHRHRTMYRKGSDWNYEAKYCDMCGKRLEEHHDAD